MIEVGSKVKLTPEGVNYYGGAYPHYTPASQGQGSNGLLLFAGDRPHDPRAAARPYYVRWDNGAENSYRLEDIELAESTNFNKIVVFGEFKK